MILVRSVYASGNHFVLQSAQERSEHPRHQIKSPPPYEQPEGALVALVAMCLG